MEKLELIPIVDLLNRKFFIPSYQRGYRWEERQVLDLLEDILEFQQKNNKEEGEFYCLQPIVVTNISGGKWEVIDGQQRLTTLYLILLYLDNLLKEDYFIDEIFSISYQTRRNSQEFLEKQVKGIEGTDIENTDYYHISNAYLVIIKWFEENIRNKNTTKRKFLEILIDKNIEYNNKKEKDIANNVRFIWYEIDKKRMDNSEYDESIEIFTRINMGKIPLTNSELIKALFFINENSQKKETERHQLKIAYEWDNIEFSLQNDNFWYFLNRVKNNKSTRIEYIFDLIAKKHFELAGIKVNKSIDEYYTFYIINELIRRKKISKIDLWDDIKTYFRTFEEWHQNNEYYHLVGYSIQIGKNIGILNNESRHRSKNAFKDYLVNEIRGNFKNQGILELSYGDDNIKINEILLLFSVITTMNSKFSKFPFERYINGQWSLEHIHAQNSEELKTDKQRKSVLEEQKEFFEKYKKEEALINRIGKLLEKVKVPLDEFKELQDKIFDKYSDDISLHTIDNMALLLKDDNSALNNNIFPIKRDKIKELDEKGSFIPICTKNVFLKYYSKYVEQNVRWDKEDREAYLREIKHTLIEYLPEDDTNGN